ncbi:hypothetical protein PoB_007009300 [Plakobranchus ocellatus]|uniref:LSM domain-containing protein n=1 Tax=Plakobranchus ocellatus TaxID=259542 RepID=A0AAV4DH69_9GAST|nr:hypothetical protein PoB_007009300 [Plakobranchus ocellatus]
MSVWIIKMELVGKSVHGWIGMVLRDVLEYNVVTKDEECLIDRLGGCVVRTCNPVSLHLKDSARLSFTNLSSSPSSQAIPTKSSAHLGFVVFVPHILTVLSWSSRVSVMIRSGKTLKRKDESWHPCRIATGVWNSLRCPGKALR